MTTTARNSAKLAAEQDTEQAAKKPSEGAPMHEAVLTPADYTFLASLAEQRALDGRVRVDMAALLMNDETLTALVRYEDFFAFGGVDVAPAVAALPLAIRLQRIKRQLELAGELVQRHIAATSEPLVSVVSDVRRMVVATPEGSAMRDAFAVFDAQWVETFRGGRTASSDTAATPATPSGDLKSPK